MKRRDFFKLLGKGAAVVGVAGLFGLPEIEKPEWKFSAPKYDKDADIIRPDAFDIPAGFPRDSFKFDHVTDALHYNCRCQLEPSVFDGSVALYNLTARFLTDDEIDKIYKDAKRLFFGSKFPELAPLWGEDENNHEVS